VFQRPANYCVPARNGKVNPEVVKARKADYDSVVKRISQSFFGFEYDFIPKSVLEATPDEREREFDRMWDAGGFAFWLANYQDMFFNQEANDLCADYIKRKIRKTVKDPVIAEKLIPKGMPTAPSASLWAPTTTRPSTRITCSWWMPIPTAVLKKLPKRASKQVAGNTNATSSSSPPASML